MRRQLLIVIAVFTVALAACGGDAAETATETADGGSAAAQDSEEPEVQFATLEEGTLTVGSDIPFPPFEYEEAGALTGFDVDLMEEIGSRLGVEVKWVDTSFDTIFTQLAAGQFDMVASATTITEERAATVNFTEPYYRAQQALTVNSEQSPDIASVDDLGQGDSVAVQTGTTGESWANENLGPQGVQVRTFPEAGDTFTAVEAGQVTGVIFDEPAAVDAAQGREALAVVDTIDTGEEFGFPVNPGNEPLLDAANQTLSAMFGDGTYQQIYEQYFPEAPAGNVVGGEETEATATEG
ncbi:MAG TPA: basic amino acid ABC transporter substrate-binding protein [Euzebyales bacterium]